MREVTVDFLRSEATRLGALLPQTRIFHPAGVRLHAPGIALTVAEIKAMADVGMKTVFLLEPGEGEQAAKRILSTELVERRNLQPVDFLAEDLKGPDGAVLFPAGTCLEGEVYDEVLALGRASVTIRKRGLTPMMAQAESYLARIPPPPPRAPRPDSRLTQAVAAPIRPLLVPRGKIFVAMQDEFQRVLLANTIAGEGHDLTSVAASSITAGLLQQMRPDVLILDLDSAPTVVPLLRKGDVFRRMAILVTAAEGRKQEVYKAFMAGANGSIPLPPRRDGVLEKVRGAMLAFGHGVMLKPSVQTERRVEARDAGNFVCTLQDKFLKTPLPVTQATVQDIGEGGIRIEYAVPSWPHLHAYMGHGVHPQHFWYNYAKESPLGRDLTLMLPPASGRSMELQVKFVHVAINGVYESAGLAFHRVRGSVRDHMTTVRGAKPGSTRRSF